MYGFILIETYHFVLNNVASGITKYNPENRISAGIPVKYQGSCVYIAG
jgi:hypothetical protein